jgi:hypothetical protein
MFGRPLRLAHGPDAKGSKRTGESRLASATIGGAEAFWLALIAALIALAPTPGANPSRGLTGFSPGCLFVGKGGVICNGSAAAAKWEAAENPDRCLSLGKGGRFCPPTK